MLTWRGADVARETTARMRRGTETAWQGRGWPTRGVGGADMWYEATRVHADAWVAPRGRGDGKWRAHGLVGPG